MARRRLRLDEPRLLASRVVNDVVQRGLSSAESLDRHLSYHVLTPRDRAFVTALVYGTLTYWLRFDYDLNTVLDRPLETLDPHLHTVLNLALFQCFYADRVPTYAAIDTSVELAAYYGGAKAKPFVNAVLRRLVQARPAVPTRWSCLTYGLSPEVYGLLKASYGVDTAEAIAAHATLVDRTICVRLNQTLHRPPWSDLATWLSEGAPPEIKPGLLCDTALRLTAERTNPITYSGYAQGRFSLQNEASQLACRLALANRPTHIAEVGAGRGGKTGALLEASQAAGRRVTLTAIDRSEAKRDANRETLRRLGLDDTAVRYVVADASDPAVDWGDPYDLVMVDAPCSGFGVMARRPEIRLRHTYATVVALAEQQKALLNRAAQAVRPGGVLMYLTCTLNAMENDDQIDAFLVHHPEFTPDPFGQTLPAALLSYAHAGRLTLLPHRDGVDGFFIQKLRRTRCA